MGKLDSIRRQRDDRQDVFRETGISGVDVVCTRECECVIKTNWFEEGAFRHASLVAALPARAQMTLDYRLSVCTSLS